MATHPITLDQLADLNAEIAALSRAGVPMEAALQGLGRDLPGRLGKITTELGRRMEKGDRLEDVVARSDDLLPPVYRAVVVAGVRSGRLSVALEGFSTTAHRISHLRRLIGVSLLYPLFVIGLTYGLFVWLAAVWAPGVIESFREFGAETPWLSAVVTIGSTARWWAPWLPIVFLVLLWFGWRRSARPTTNGRFSRGGLPGIGRVVRAASLSTFADLLRLLVEQEVPLDEATVLAADASGDPKLARASRQMAERIQQGGKPGGESNPGGFPPMLAWIIETCRQPAELAGTLRLYADSYHAEAIRAGRWASIYLPILLAAGLGGSVVALFAVGTLGPWFELLHEMASP